jgi:hypothetical protein
MEKERKHTTYASKNLSYQTKANRYQETILKSPVSYYENRLFETVVGSLIRKYLSLNNPKTIFYHTSPHDDFFSGADHIVSQPDNSSEFVRIDLTVGDGRIRSLEKSCPLQTINKKITGFHTRPGIPEEFFEAIRPSESPKPLPLIILRMNRVALSLFINDYFKTMVSEKRKIDILEHFHTWMNYNVNITSERIAHILGLTKTPHEHDQTAKLAVQISTLFAGTNNVAVDMIQ